MDLVFLIDKFSSEKSQIFGLLFRLLHQFHFLKSNFVMNLLHLIVISLLIASLKVFGFLIVALFLFLVLALVSVDLNFHWIVFHFANFALVALTENYHYPLKLE
jgi:hypothetical protein